MLNNNHRRKLNEKYGLSKEEVEKLEKMELLVSLKRDGVNKSLARDDIPGGGMLINYPNGQGVITIRLDEAYAPDTTEDINITKRIQEAGALIGIN